MMNNENGRSMVEMLGVLAIIGVLSVAGIAGYTMAMNKYKANELVNVASQLAVMAEAQYVNTSTALTGYDATKLGLSGTVGGIAVSDIKASYDGATGTITLTGLSNDSIKKQIGVATKCKLLDKFTLTPCTS